jgi:hypothetical protein
MAERLALLRPAGWRARIVPATRNALARSWPVMRSAATGLTLFAGFAVCIVGTLASFGLGLIPDERWRRIAAVLAFDQSPPVWRAVVFILCIVFLDAAGRCEAAFDKWAAHPMRRGPESP